VSSGWSLAPRDTEIERIVIDEMGADRNTPGPCSGYRPTHRSLRSQPKGSLSPDGGTRRKCTNEQ
jgi:hypothetical protein